MKKIVTLILVAFLPVLASAYDAEINGICYDFNGNTATVTYRDNNGNNYSGEVVIPETVTYNDMTCRVTAIGDIAFIQCKDLTSVTIPGSVTSIGRSAFDDCDLKSVVTLIEEPFAINRKNESNYRTFSINTFNNATLYVPAGTIDKYKATEGWKDFENIEEIDVTEVSEVKAMPVLLQREGSELIVNGAAAGIPISVYDLSGKLIGNTTATEGTTRVQATASAKVVIVKVGERSVKLR